MTFRALILRNRSYRRFYQEVKVDRETLRELVELARLSASPMNRQPLKYMLSCDPERNAVIFRHLGWAAFLKDWPGPEEGERPAAYIVVLGDKSISDSFAVDYGIAAQAILLGATERGLGGCTLSSVHRFNLRKALEIPAKYEILIVIAIGKPKEIVVLETIGPKGDTRYWRDDEGRHHVPKRSLDEIILD